jgi:hypothetical protein
MLDLFPDEQVVSTSSDNSVTLTTHRICKEEKDWGRAYNQSIMLEHITSCENAYNSQVWLLILAGLCFVGGLLAASNNNTSAFGTATLFAIVLAGLYWLTRSNFITIASPSTKMKLKVTGMKKEQVLAFINQVEQTKHKRLTSLNNRPNMTS